MPDLEEVVSEVLDLIEKWGSACEDDPQEFVTFEPPQTAELQMDLFKMYELLRTLVEDRKES